MTEYESPEMTRRDALKGGSAAAVAAGSYLLQQQLVGVAAAQTTEPRIQLGPDWVIDDDPDGNGYFAIEHTPNGNRYIFQDDGTVDVAGATTETLSVTNESLVNVYRSDGNNQSLSSGTWATLGFDTEVDDYRDEFNLSTDQFVPDTTGYYFVSIQAWFKTGADGDAQGIRFRDVDAGADVAFDQRTAGGSSLKTRSLVFMKELTAGTTYEVGVRNNTSSDTIFGDSRFTFLNIRSTFA